MGTTPRNATENVQFWLAPKKFPPSHFLLFFFQLVKHCIGIAEFIDLNPRLSLIFSVSCFTAASVVVLTVTIFRVRAVLLFGSLVERSLNT